MIQHAVTVRPDAAHVDEMRALIEAQDGSTAAVVRVIMRRTARDAREADGSQAGKPRLKTARNSQYSKRPTAVTRRPAGVTGWQFQSGPSAPTKRRLARRSRWQANSVGVANTATGDMRKILQGRIKRFCECLACLLLHNLLLLALIFLRQAMASTLRCLGLPNTSDWSLPVMLELFSEAELVHVALYVYEEAVTMARKMRARLGK
jgi:hypothetical protein